MALTSANNTSLSAMAGIAAESESMVLFDALVREYCEIGFFEALACPAADLLTSAVWEEEGSKPSPFARIVVELLHRAAQRA